MGTTLFLNLLLNLLDLSLIPCHPTDILSRLFNRQQRPTHDPSDHLSHGEEDQATVQWDKDWAGSFSEAEQQYQVPFFGNSSCGCVKNPEFVHEVMSFGMLLSRKMDYPPKIAKPKLRGILESQTQQSFCDSWTWMFFVIWMLRHFALIQTTNKHVDGFNFKKTPGFGYRPNFIK